MWGCVFLVGLLKTSGGARGGAGGGHAPPPLSGSWPPPQGGQGLYGGNVCSVIVGGRCAREHA